MNVSREEERPARLRARPGLLLGVRRWPAIAAGTLASLTSFGWAADGGRCSSTSRASTAYASRRSAAALLRALGEEHRAQVEAASAAATRRVQRWARVGGFAGIAAAAITVLGLVLESLLR